MKKRQSDASGKEKRNWRRDEDAKGRDSNSMKYIRGIRERQLSGRFGLNCSGRYENGE